MGAESHTSVQSDSFDLPPLPALDVGLLRVDAVETQVGRLEALVPVDQPPGGCSNRPAILLIPGLGMDGLGFIRQLPLAKICDLYFFQTPNAAAHGEHGLGHFARYVEEYILARQLDKHRGGLLLGGNSMGGAISQLIAIRGRVQPHSLVLIGTFGSCKHLPLVQRLAAPLAWVVPMNFFRACLWLCAGAVRWHRTTPSEGRWLARPLIRRTHGYFGRSVVGLTRLNLIDDLSKLSLPTLVIHGSADGILRLAAGVELAETIPDAQLRVIENAGHCLFFTNPIPVNHAIANFVTQLGTRGAPFQPGQDTHAAHKS